MLRLLRQIQDKECEMVEKLPLDDNQTSHHRGQKPLITSEDGSCLKCNENFGLLPKLVPPG